MMGLGGRGLGFSFSFVFITLGQVGLGYIGNFVPGLGPPELAKPSGKKHSPLPRFSCLKFTLKIGERGLTGTLYYETTNNLQYFRG